MIKVKISDLLNSTDVLQKLSKMDLKAKLAWQVSKLLKAADAEIQSFNETRMTLIKKYGQKDDSGELVTDDKGNCKITEGSVEEFSNELNELLNAEVELNVNKVKIDELGEITFTPSDMVQLEPFIEFEE